ncbi:hypothetical protein DID88_008147 [Monilinia fructigena]|uniref:Uncharacterized protein n=1 Tax=Monilinia fructigena TaxID=38457 RepID=A0A395J4W9_9HELO|nr:hypothetical protein DID88_008147 [Monilinia fructigena]
MLMHHPRSFDSQCWLNGRHTGSPKKVFKKAKTPVKKKPATSKVDVPSVPTEKQSVPNATPSAPKESNDVEKSASRHLLPQNQQNDQEEPEESDKEDIKLEKPTPKLKKFSKTKKQSQCNKNLKSQSKKREAPRAKKFSKVKKPQPKPELEEQESEPEIDQEEPEKVNGKEEHDEGIDMADDVITSAPPIPEDFKQSIEPLKSITKPESVKQATKPVEDAKDSAPEPVKEATKRPKKFLSKASKAAQGTQGQANGGVDKVKEATGKVPGADQATDAVSGATHTTKDAGSKAQGDVEKASGDVKDVAQDAKDKVGGATGGAQKKLGSFKDTAGKSLESAIDDVRIKQNTTDDAKIYKSTYQTS